MKVLLLALFTLPLLAQTTVQERPDCFFPVTFTNTPSSNSNAFDDRTPQCNQWIFSYTSVSYATVSITVQTAPVAAGGIPGAWSTYTAVVGINPNTSTTGALTTFGGPNSTPFAFLRVSVTTTGASGSIQGLLYGWRVPASPPSSGGCPGTPATPCVVDGPTAAGSPPTTPPVLVAGQDGAPGNIRVIKTDALGDQLVSGIKSNNAGVPGSTNLGVLPCIANAAAPTWIEGDQVLCSVDLSGNLRVSLPANQFTACNNQAIFNLAASGNSQIIAASGSTTIRICHIDFSTTAPEDIKLTTGTGANCVTGTADLTGLLKSVQSADLNYTPFSPLVGVASAALCINPSTNTALGGTVIYAQF